MLRTDSHETGFYTTNGTFLAPEIPASLGGIYVFCDGPVALATQSLGTMIVTWTIELKGIRAFDNVAIRPREWADIDSSDEDIEPVEIIRRNGKEYIRVGEAKNPGPEDEDLEDPL